MPLARIYLQLAWCIGPMASRKADLAPTGQGAPTGKTLRIGETMEERETK